MRSHVGANARPLTLMIIAALACASFATPLSAAAAVSTPQIQAKKAEAAAASEQLADLNAQFEMKVEEYDAITEALGETRTEITRTQRRLEEASNRLTEAQDRLAERAQAIYMGGQIDVIAVLVGTTSFDDLITRIEMLNRITASDADLVDEVTRHRDSVLAAEAALTTRESEQVALRQQAEAKKVQVEAALEKQQSYVKGLTAEVAKLVQEEEERQRRIAAELAARAAAEAAARAAKPRESSGTPGSPHPEAVSIALKYVGVPYVWGGSSPSGFDCSGFVQYVYLQLGIALPRTSRQQYRVGAFIAADALGSLQPGDLVFFGYNGDPGQVHHVGMYVGSGNFVHAPGTGDRVKVSSLLDRIATRRDYVGAVRP